jgi:hypothetical protein
MERIATTLCGLALAGLAGCSTYDPNYSASPPNPDPMPSTSMRTAPAPAVAAAPVPVAPVAETPVTTAPPAGTVAYRAGNGWIESISLVYMPALRAPSASAGSSVANAPDPGPYRINVRMDDGSLQSMIVDTRSFMVGDRVQLMTDGRMGRM